MAHSHNHAPPTLNSKDINRSFLIGIALNAAYVVIELFYGWKIGSTALLSDAVHNIGDISGLLLAFLAFRLLRFKPNSVFTYGLKKGSVLASFINSILLAFAIGAIAWEGVRHILNPHNINGNIVMIVAAIGIVINFSSALLFRNKKKDDLNIKAAYWHLMADALVSLGVVISGLIIKYTGWNLVDGIAAILVALVILGSTWSLFKDSIIAMMDGVPSEINTHEITSHIKEVAGVAGVHHIHIWSMSTNENALTSHIVVEDLNDIPRIKSDIKEELKEHNITHSTLEFELIEEKCLEKNKL
ncbi:cation diffusion facilitator family transporter [Polaribacter sp. Q13]|uniref:cation diffusion facilitator family transporter n=1 Tax=Polaribacter sp. Q13 TaxID=2806551 RepID=UPI00193C7465|nr:cation diffusion facilitator family transporter [Polaribacter sp. Q13]QVY66197.1 cation transporter [Polaribacter sp. Q13]